MKKKIAIIVSFLTLTVALAAWSFPPWPPSSVASYVSDGAYDAGTWDADTTHAPSKNSVRDKIEALDAAKMNVSGACSVMTGVGGAATLTPGLSRCYTFTVTDNEDTTITAASGGTAGEELTIIFLTAGAGDEIITFHAANMASTGTLTLEVTAARYYVVKFISNGTRWFEVSRTGAQT
jgi:hypothetical protein